MRLTEKKNLTEQSYVQINSIYDEFSQAEHIDFSCLPAKNTALIIIDVIKGFVEAGALSSPSIKEIIPDIKAIMDHAGKADMKIILFADCHNPQSTEFAVYPEHCIDGTDQSEPVDEIASVGEYILIKKNCTNGLLSKTFQEYLIRNPQINHFVITGCCSDICVMQFSQTLKCIFHQNNKNAEVIIPMNCIETYDSENHNNHFFNLIALKLMQNCGIRIVSKICFNDN